MDEHAQLLCSRIAFSPHANHPTNHPHPQCFSLGKQQPEETVSPLIQEKWLTHRPEIQPLFIISSMHSSSTSCYSPKVKWSTALTSSTLLPGHVHQQNSVVVLHCSNSISLCVYKSTTTGSPCNHTKMPQPAKLSNGISLPISFVMRDIERRQLSTPPPNIIITLAL